MKSPAWNYPYVTVTNQAGESALSVIGRLATQLRACSVCQKYYGKNPISSDSTTLVLQDGIIPVGCTAWVLGGTEQGFSIPHPPFAVSASYEKNSDSIILEWANPLSDLDKIEIVYNSLPLATLPGKTTRYVHRRGGAIDAGFSSDDVTVFVMGCKAGVPSNGSGVRLLRHTLQESLMNIPFTQGIAPSFQAWKLQSKEESIQLEQGNLPGMHPGAETLQFQGKGFYQVIKGRGLFNGGVSRRFIGLTPEHTYRVGARMNTLETKSTNKWAFSFHAAFDTSNSVPLTAEQMAGSATLPDGSKGPLAGLIAKYATGETTSREWTNHFSAGGATGNLCTDVTLPKQGSDSITVWFRLTGNNATNVVVGIDSVTIEDLGVLPKK